ncbi:MAG: polyamine aminopropyltransferase [Candidatus Aminicenantes bacterium]|nr:polyamine aminopropyltransferase [Candidatus Aminicenantes bacterium]
MKNKALDLSRHEAREYHTNYSGIFFKAKKVLLDKKSKFQRIEIIENQFFGKVLFLDGLVQTTEKDEFFYHEMLVHPALACHPHPARVLIIGGGDGGALREALKHPVEKVWLVEIDQEVIRACEQHFPWLEEALADSRAELAIADGFDFIQQTRDRFDVIIVDSSDPVGPSAVLHARNFYQKLKKVLKPDGIIVAQAGSQLLHLEEHGQKYRFLKKMFEHTLFYFGPVPTYPMGTWCYNFLSDVIDPREVKKLRIPEGLKYYNQEIHAAAFSRPQFFLEKLK